MNLLHANLPVKPPSHLTPKKLPKAKSDSCKVFEKNGSLETLPSWTSHSPGSSREDVTFDTLSSRSASGSQVLPTHHDFQIPSIVFTKFQAVEERPCIGYLLGDEFLVKGDPCLKVRTLYIPRNQDVHNAATYSVHCEEMKTRLDEVACREREVLKVIGCMYNRGFPNTVQHVQRNLQLKDSRAVTCVMKQDTGVADNSENWSFYRLTDEGLKFWSNGVLNDEYQSVDDSGKPLFVEVEVKLVCPLREQIYSLVLAHCELYLSNQFEHNSVIEDACGESPPPHTNHRLVDRSA